MAVLGAKAFFIVAGLAQQTLLQWAIGLAGYGALSRVTVFSNVVNNVMVSSSIQGVSRAVARAPGHEEEALRATMRVHVPLALLLAALFALGAPFMAAFEHAPYITAPLLVMAGVVGLYGVYAPLVGSLNGRGRFGRQAALDVTSAALRTLAVVAIGRMFFLGGGSGVLGVTVGAVVAAACVLPLAVHWAGTGRASSQHVPGVPRAAEYLMGLWPLAVAQLFTNILMQSDLALLGRFLSQSAGNLGLENASAIKLADEWTGIYRSCQLFAFLPYQLLFSVTQVLFPMLARAKAEGDMVAVRAYVLRGARLAAIVCGLLVSVVVVAPGSLLAFAYSADVAARGENALRVLALGQGAFAMMGIATTVLASLGKERISAIITFGALTLVSIACFWFVPAQLFGAAQLQATAIATSVALLGALVAAGAAVRALTGAFIPLKTALRVGLALALCFVVGPHVPRVTTGAWHFRLVVIAIAIAVAVAYIAFLFATGELGKEDIALVRTLARRKRP